MAKILDGKKIARRYREALKREIQELHAQGMKPTLADIVVGDNPACVAYFNVKKKLSEELGIHFLGVPMPASTTENELIRTITQYNEREEVDGIFVELPLPVGINSKKIRNAIAPQKDVDGINPVNLGRLMIGEEAMLPATPYGVIEFLKSESVQLEGKEAVVVGRSEVVGKPLALLLLQENATVTICHSKTRNLAEKTRRADILCVAVGSPGLIRAPMVKEGAVVIDIGMTATKNGIVGDVAFEEVSKKTSLITPVPGGVGPMTTTMIMRNVVKAAKIRAGM